MAQHDINIANQTFPDFRGDLNAALAAAFSSSAGATEPTTKVAGQLWLDTANNELYIRSAANTNWWKLFGFAGGAAILAGRVSGVDGTPGWPAFTFGSDSNTGMYRIANDRAALSAGGTPVLEWTPGSIYALVGVRSDQVISTSSQFRASGTGDSPSRPGYSWTDDINTGMYRAGPGIIGFSTNSNRRMLVSDTIQADVPVVVPQGSTAAPGLSFKFRESSGFIIDPETNGIGVVINGNLIGTFRGGRWNGQVAGDGSLITGLSSAEVCAAIAAAAVGAVGTYALLCRKSGSTGFTQGDVVAGSALAYTGFSDDGNHTNSVSPAGSWKALGFCNDGTRPATLFVRV